MDSRPYVLGLVEMVDWNINFGNVLTIGVIVGGWAYTIIQMKSDVREIKAQMKAVALLVTNQAVFSNRMENLEQDVRNVEKDVRELRHGEGFVRGARGIDREYGP